MPRKKRNKWTRIPHKNKLVDAVHLDSDEISSMPLLDDCDDVAESATTHNTIVRHFDLRKNNIPLKNLFVYTKRLDEMKAVLNPQTVTDHVRFFEQIVDESKPKATEDLLKHQMTRDNKSGGPMAYVKLKYKIDRININIGHKKKMIERIQNSKLQESDFENQLTIVNDVTKLKIPKTYLRNGKEMKTVCKLVKDSKALIPTFFYRNNYIIIKNLKTNEADVYYLNNTGMVTQHHRTDDGKHIFFQSSPNTALIPYCCWYQRQDIVTSMLLYVPSIAVRCMGVAHSCEVRCVCCCRNLIQTFNSENKTSKEFTSQNIDAIPKQTAKTGQIEVDSEIVVTPAPFNVLIDNMLKKSRSLPYKPNLIKKAFAFTPEKETKRRIHNKSLNFVAGTQILFNYKDGNEYYKIGPRGNISRHLRNVSLAFIEQHVVSDKNAINKKVCCWFARHSLINAWRNSKILPSNYIRSQHTCPLDKCVCCCEPIKLAKNKTNNNFKKVSLPDIPNYTTEVCTKLPPLRFAFAKHELAPLNKIVPVIDISPIDNQAVVCTDKTTDPDAKDTVADAVSENRIEVVDKAEVEKRMLICLNTKLLLEKEFVKLKDVCVQFNRNDKITAVLNIPVTTMSTDELRTLSSILNQAQKNIDALKEVHSDNIINNPFNPKAIIVNDRDKNLQNQLRFTAKNNLYSIFSRWSSLHNVEYLNSFRVFINRRIRILKNKEIKRQNSCLRAAIPTKRRNVAETPQQTKRLFRIKRTYKRTKKESSPTNSYKTQAQSKILKTALQWTEDAKAFEIQNEPGPSDDPLDITSFDSIAKKPSKSKGGPSPDIEKPLIPIDMIVPIYDSSDQDEGVSDELPSVPIEIISSAQVNDVDCILGA